MEDGTESCCCSLCAGSAAVREEAGEEGGVGSVKTAGASYAEAASAAKRLEVLMSSDCELG